jgi:hypothetical protein
MAKGILRMLLFFDNFEQSNQPGPSRPLETNASFFEDFDNAAASKPG